VRNRTALFWNLVFPAIFIVLFGAIFSRDQGVEFSVGIAGGPSTYRDQVVEVMSGVDAYDVTIGDPDHELEALRDGDRQVVLVFASDPEPAGGGLPGVELYFDASDGPTAQVAVGAVRQLLLMVATAGLDQPLTIDERPVRADDVDFIDFFVPGILAMSLMNAGVIGTSTIFVSYRERGMLRRLRMTPFPLSSFIVARIVSQLIIAVAQTLILVGMARLLFGLDIRGNPLLILGVLVVGALAFLAIGFAISGIANNVETAAAYANLVTFPMLFLSGVFFSIDVAPAWLQPVTRALPLSYLVDALREPMTRDRGLEAIWIDLLVLMATFAVGMIVAVRLFRWDATNR
jgi:ABC-2 type transport system permease protein